MAKLPEDAKGFIVRLLACYHTPSEVAEAVKEEFGIEIPRQQAQEYDPTKGEKPARKWCDLFHETREKFLKSASEIPEANKAVRIDQLARMAREARKRKNYGLAKELLEQIAKEEGGAFTNHRILSGPGGAAVAHEMVVRFQRPVKKSK